MGSWQNTSLFLGMEEVYSNSHITRTATVAGLGFCHRGRMSCEF